MKETRSSFLGRGWSFPPEFSANEHGVSMVEAEDDILQCLHILLATERGERTMQPEFGCNLSSVVFDSLTTTQETLIKDMIRTAILYHEPRIDLESIIFQQNGDTNKLIIEIEYTIRSTNSRGNMVFPFYKDEGTNITR